LPTSGYTDLKIVTSARGTVNLGSGYVDGILTFNGTTTGYSERMVYGLGGSANSVSQSSTGIKWGNWANDTSTTANTFGNSETYIPNYRSSNFKSVSVDGVQENNASGSAITALNAGLWSNTAAITSITFTAGSGSFAANSTFSLYGVAALGTTPVLAPKATGGNIVANDGTYWYHAFISSGNFVPQTGLTAECLVIAGGGAGGANAGGGGGAGGFRSATSLALTVQNYPITVGAGGSGTNIVSPPTSGSDSVFSTITSTGGGRGGSNAGYVALTGGSGGGGGMYDSLYDDGAAGNTPSTSPSQGSNGGNGGGLLQAENASGGGGGGATANGGNASNGTPGNGGAGSSAFSTWASVTSTGVSGSFAGGGGGGAWNSSGAISTGGSGGGGAGGRGGNGTFANSTSGTANTGGGGGGGGVSSSIASGNGGSGIVIIRYPIA